MTIFTKLSNLLTSAIELPSALHAVAEAAREMESSRAIVSEHDGAQICGKLAERIAELEKELDLAKDENSYREKRYKIAEESLLRFLAWASPLAHSLTGAAAEGYVSDVVRDHIERITRDLNREREARRWRKQSEEPAPFGRAVLERFSGGGIMKCKGQAVFETNEWRYLSPEDMPND